MSDCPEQHRTQAYHDGELAPQAAAEFERHLPDCQTCQQELAGLSSISRAFAQARQSDEKISQAQLSQIHHAIDQVEDRGLLRLVGSLGAIAASVLIVSLAWLGQGMQHSRVPSVQKIEPPPRWEQMAATGELRPPPQLSGPVLADRQTARWMLVSVAEGHKR